MSDNNNHDQNNNSSNGQQQSSNCENNSNQQNNSCNNSQQQNSNSNNNSQQQNNGCNNNKQNQNNRNGLATHEMLELHELINAEIISAKKTGENLAKVQDKELKSFMEDCLNSKKSSLEQMQQFISNQTNLQ